MTGFLCVWYICNSKTHSPQILWESPPGLHTQGDTHAPLYCYMVYHYNSCRIHQPDSVKYQVILVTHLGQQQNSFVYRWQFIVFGFVSSPYDTNQGADTDAIDTEEHTYMLTTMACYEFDCHWTYTEVHCYHYYIPDSQTWLAPCSDWEKYPE